MIASRFRSVRIPDMNSARSKAPVALSFLLLAACSLLAADYPAAIPGNFVIRDFRFGSGEVLPELRLHYLTFGSLRRDDNGRACNAVLILHGTTGNSSNFLRADFAGDAHQRGRLDETAAGGGDLGH